MNILKQHYTSLMNKDKTKYRKGVMDTMGWDTAQTFTAHLEKELTPAEKIIAELEFKKLGI